MRAKLVTTARKAWHVPDEVLFRQKNPLFARQVSSQATERARQATQVLESEGIVFFNGFVSGTDLSEMQKSFSEMIDQIEKDPPGPERELPKGRYSGTYREHGVNEELETVYSYQPYIYSPRFLELSLDPLFLDIAGLYFGRKFMLHQSTASRYYPTAPRDFGSWQWHHDAWGKRINVMLLLTDVEENDQYMTYLKGSHKLIHSYDRYENSRFTEEEVRAKGTYEEVKCLAPAGSVVLFDPNGFHRGNRSLGRARDSIIWSYSCGRYIWPFDIPSGAATGLTPRQREALERNPRISYV